MKTTLVILLSTLLAHPLCAQSDLAERLAKATRDSYPTLIEFYSIPNDAHFPEQIEPNVVWCEEAFGELGFTTQRLETETVPLLLAEYHIAGAEKTVLIYLQIDGQPVDPSKWDQETPFTPTLKAQNDQGEWETIPMERLYDDYDPEYRMFVRAASDAKGPVMMFLTAWKVMQELGETPSYSVKVIMDFEEELGSPHLPQAVQENREALAADALLIFDGPRHPSNLPTLTFGARGIATITLTVFGPKAPQHSGHYGNWAPNPAFRLMQLVGGMKDEQGRVVIPGYYDGITIDDNARAIMDAVPDDEEAIMQQLGIAETDAVGITLQEAIQYPSLNVRGMSAGWVGSEKRTIVPATAVAEIDVRLVKESDPERLIGLTKGFIEDQGYHFIAGDEPTDTERKEFGRLAHFTYNVSYGAFRTEVDSELGQWLIQAVTHTLGQEPIIKRTSGGSIPISPFVNTLGIPAVTVPTVNPDNNQHSPNENIRMGNYTEGIKELLGILREEW
ncbi:MAG TPA: acetylornithine deacetylase [Cytophagales bacterium]|nr:acetylornithine deacetylase [Cytophagales bacterium]HAP61591.1 acetylornithine deacetylase [Cytophagales bacterium]